MPIVVGLAGPARRVAGARSAAPQKKVCPPPSRRGTRWAARRRATSPAHTSRSYASGKSSSQTQSRDKSNQKVHLNKSHNPSPPPYRVIPVTRVPRRSWPPARWPRATAYAKHPTPRHRLRAKSYLREGERGGVRGCPVGRSGCGVRPPHHRTLGIAPWAVPWLRYPFALPPWPGRYGPGAMALARPTTAHSAPRLAVRPRPRALCTTAPAHPQPSTRHAPGEEAALVAPPQPVHLAAGQSAAAVSGCRATRAASGSQRCSLRTAGQCRGRSRGSRSSRSPR